MKTSYEVIIRDSVFIKFFNSVIMITVFIWFFKETFIFLFKYTKCLNDIAIDFIDISISIVLVIIISFYTILTILTLKKLCFYIEENGNLICINSRTKQKTIYQRKLIKNFFYEKPSASGTRGLYMLYGENNEIRLAYEYNAKEFLKLATLLCINFPDITNEIRDNKVNRFLKTQKSPFAWREILIKVIMFWSCLAFVFILIIYIFLNKL